MKESVLRVVSSIPPLQSDGGVLVSDPTGKAAVLSNFFMGSSPELLLAVLHLVIARPSFVFSPLGPVRFDSCFLTLVLTVALICWDLIYLFLD